jgi:hypothetical protein
MKEPYQSANRCAYELCKRADPITITPGHRRKLYHDDACRQAQHRLLSARRTYATLCQLWAAFLPETRAVLRQLLEEHGEAWTRRLIRAICAERDQARQPALTEDERAALRAQYAEFQPFTRTILDALAAQPHDALSLLNLVLLALGEERTHAMCNSEGEQRAAYLEIQLSEERARSAELERQLETGAFPMNQPAPPFDLEKDLAAVRINTASPDLLATPYGQALLLVKEREREVQHLQTRIQKQYERRIAKLQARLRELEAERAEWTEWRQARLAGGGDLSAMRTFLQEHEEATIPIKRNGVVMKVWALGPDGVACTEDHGILRLNDEELQQGRVWVCKKLGLPIIVTRLPIGSKRDSAEEDE